VIIKELEEDQEALRRRTPDADRRRSSRDLLEDLIADEQVAVTRQPFRAT